MNEIKEYIKDGKKLKVIGTGQFGLVYKVEFQGKEYAIKKISKEKIDFNKEVDSDYMKKALKREIELIKRMSQYENSVKFYYYFEEEKEYILVLELCDTDLKKLSEAKGRFTSSEILSIMEGLNKPFKYMHNNGILHRDIKPENIMIKYVDSSKTKFIPKIADYGISRELDNGKATTILGTPRYMAPELLLGADEYTDKSDLFSIGVLVYKLYFNEFPFKMPKNNKEVKEFYNAKKKEDCEDKILDDLLNKLLAFEPEKRISWDEYFEHPFFKNKVEDLTNKLDNLSIYDKKEHQVINVYDYVLEKIIDYNTHILTVPKQYISIDDCLLLKNEPFFILGILGKYLEQIGVNVLIEREELPRNDDLADYQKCILQFICNSYILKCKYLLEFELDENRIWILVNDPIERCNFNEKLKNILMEKYNFKEGEILITNQLRDNGKFTTVIAIKSNFNKTITKDELIKVFAEKDQELKTLIKVDKELITQKIKLSKSMLFPREDNKYNNWNWNQKRGGEVYIPPDGWIKYGIKVDHNFNDRSNDWISHHHKRGEWSVAYCCITGIDKKMEQIYENDEDIRHPGKSVGIGVYCPSDPKIMEEKTETIDANGEKYKVGFMVRVKPDKIRASKKNEKIWVVNGNDNELRPYGILIKKL